MVFEANLKVALNTITPFCLQMITRLSLIKRGVMVFNAYLKAALNFIPLFYNADI